MTDTILVVWHINPWDDFEKVVGALNRLVGTVPAGEQPNTQR